MPATNPAPFTYPPALVSRRHGPTGYNNYGSYRPWLRDEFSFRCVFCLLREQWGRVTAQFDVDHFVPQICNLALATNYDNLVYACHACNIRKGKRTLSHVHLTANNVRIYPDGTIMGLTTEAARTVELLWLNSPDSVHWRRIWIRIIEMADEHDPELWQDLMRFPDDLPDLSRLDAPGNTKPDGIGQSHFARRERGELHAIYLT